MTSTRSSRSRSSISWPRSAGWISRSRSREMLSLTGVSGPLNVATIFQGMTLSGSVRPTSRTSRCTTRSRLNRRRSPSVPTSAATSRTSPLAWDSCRSLTRTTLRPSVSSTCVSRMSLRIERLNEFFPFSPPFRRLDPEVQVDAGVQQGLDVPTCPLPDGPQHPAVLPDQHLLVRVALHVEGGPDVEEILALAPRELLDLHRDTIGQFLAGRLDGGLPDQFPDQGLLGLAGHHLRGEVLRALRQQTGDRLDQLIEVGPRETRDRNHAGERVQPADRGQTRPHLAGREPVDLVQD